MLRLDDVHTRYGQVEVLKGVSLEVRPGEIVTLIGANGAGKTTTLMAISGLVPVSAGAITWDGARMDGRPADAIVAAGIAHVPEGRRVFARLSIEENLRLGAYQRRDAAIAQDIERAFALFPVLQQRRRQLAGTLSGGEQQMLAMARGLMARPTLLLLDEPSLGLAPKLVTAVFETIRRVNREGVTILLVEQNAYLALQVAHRGYVLETGRILLSDTAEALRSNPRVQHAYLGEAVSAEGA